MGRSHSLCVEWVYHSEDNAPLLLASRAFKVFRFKLKILDGPECHDCWGGGGLEVY